jgi:hypothetical protein
MESPNHMHDIIVIYLPDQCGVGNLFAMSTLQPAVHTTTAVYG